MGKFHLIFTLSLCVCLGLLQSTAQTRMNLQECIRIALEQHPDVAQQDLRVAQSKINLRQSQFDLLPELSMGASHGWSQGRYIDPTTNLFVTQHLTSGSQWASSSATLFDGLGSFRRIAAQSYAFRAAEMDVVMIRDRLTLQVAAAYIAALAARDMVELVQNQVALTEERMLRTETLHEQGAVSPMDYHDINGEYQLDLNRLVDAEQSRRQSLVELARLLNQSIPDNVALQRLTETPAHGRDTRNAEDLYHTASSHMGVIKAADFRHQQAKHELRALRAGFLPRLSLSGGFQSRYAGTVPAPYSSQISDNLGSFANVNLSIPVFNRFNNRTQVSKAKLLVKEANLHSETQRKELQQDIRVAWIDLEASRDRYGNIEKQVDQYGESFRIAQLRFDLGDTNALEYLTAKNRLDNAEINLILSRYQWHLRQFIVDFYAGAKQY